MNNLNLNMPVLVFSVGVIIFLSAPLEIFSTHTIQEISMTGLMIELVAIIAGLIVLYRHRVTEKYLGEI